MHSALHSGLAWQILHYNPISPYIQKYFEIRPISTGFGLRAMHAEIFRVSTNFDRICITRVLVTARAVVARVLQWQDQTACACCSQTSLNMFSRILHHICTILLLELHAHAAVLTGLNLFLVQFHHNFIICMRALLSCRQVQTFSFVDLPIAP
jgi:hypothetical protein